MKLRRYPRTIVGALLLSAITTVGSGCAGHTDFAAFRAHLPRSILVLPPLNDSNDPAASLSYLSVVTRPIAERGFYVYPVAVVHEFLKQNGMPTAGEMHQIRPQKFREILGADAVLYIEITGWGSAFHLVETTEKVSAIARLFDAASGELLWQAERTTKHSSNAAGGSTGLAALLVGAVVSQVVNDLVDNTYVLARQNAHELFDDDQTGLLLGPRHPEFRAQP